MNYITEETPDFRERLFLFKNFLTRELFPFMMDVILGIVFLLALTTLPYMMLYFSALGTTNLIRLLLMPLLNIVIILSIFIRR